MVFNVGILIFGNVCLVIFMLLFVGVSFDVLLFKVDDYFFCIFKDGYFLISGILSGGYI